MSLLLTLGKTSYLIVSKGVSEGWSFSGKIVLLGVDKWISGFWFKGIWQNSSLIGAIKNKISIKMRYVKKLWKMKSLTPSEGSVITFILLLINFFPPLRKHRRT